MEQVAELRKTLAMWMTWLDTAEGAYRAFPVELRRQLAARAPEADAVAHIAHLSGLSPETRRVFKEAIGQVLDQLPQVSSPCRLAVVDGGASG